MVATQVFTLNNVALAAAPPSVNLPTDAGIAIPPGKTSWDLAFDLGGTVPAGQLFQFMVQYLIGGVWQDDAGGTFVTGPYNRRAGGTSTIAHESSSIGTRDNNGNMVGSYPSAARVRVDQSGAWTLPSITLTLA